MPGDPPPPAASGLLLEDLKAAGCFLTRLPPRLIGYDPEATPDLRRAAGLFPIVGAAIGVAGGLVLFLASVLGLPPLIAAALAIVTTIGITGGLHEDGLADTADSLAGAIPAERLEIMQDSRIGTYGTIALAFSILLRVAALASLVGVYRATLALVAAEALSRAAMVRMWHDLPAAKSRGLSEDAGSPDQRAMLIAMASAGIIVLATAVLALGLWAAVVGSAIAALAAYIVVRFAARALGGRTGDALGACQQLAAVAFLVAVAAN